MDEATAEGEEEDEVQDLVACLVQKRKQCSATATVDNSILVPSVLDQLKHCPLSSSPLFSRQALLGRPQRHRLPLVILRFWEPGRLS